MEKMDLTKDITKYKLGEGGWLYIPDWADDPDALYQEVRKLGSPAPQSSTTTRSPDNKE
jgi:hypothetical protein